MTGIPAKPQTGAARQPHLSPDGPEGRGLDLRASSRIPVLGAAAGPDLELWSNRDQSPYWP